MRPSPAILFVGNQVDERAAGGGGGERRWIRIDPPESGPHKSMPLDHTIVEKLKRCEFSPSPAKTLNHTILIHFDEQWKITPT